MLKELLIVSGKPGLYKLVSKSSNLLIIESLIDKKRIPAYAKDKVISLGDISVYTDEDGEVSIDEVLTAIKAKENGGSVSLDISKAQADDLRAYFAEIMPNFNRDRVYPTDIKKMLKWYELLMANDITDFSKKEKDESADGEVKEEEGAAADENTAARITPTVKPAAKVTAKRTAALNSITASKAPKAKPMPRSSTPKKNVVGAKRGG
jgi:hypothetical protein